MKISCAPLAMPSSAPNVMRTVAAIISASANQFFFLRIRLKNPFSSLITGDYGTFSPKILLQLQVSKEKFKEILALKSRLLNSTLDIANNTKSK